MNYRLKSALACLCAFPSFGFLGGTGFGAMPLFAMLVVAQLRRITALDFFLAICWIMVCIIYSLAADNFPVKNFIGLISMPIIFVGLRQFFQNIFNDTECRVRILPISMFLIALLLLEGIVTIFLFGYDGIRGHTFLTLEPSHSARFFFSLILINYLVSNKILPLLLVSILFILVNKSATSVIFFSFFCLIFFFQNFLSHFFKSAALISLLMVMIIVFSHENISINSEFRFLIYLVDFREAISSFSDANFVWMVSKVGGARFVSDYVAYSGSTWIGHGVGENIHLGRTIIETDVLETHAGRYVDSVLGFSASSFGAQVTYDLGILMLPLLIAIVVPRTSISNVGRLIWFFGFFQIFLFSSTALITPWLFLAVGCSQQITKMTKTNVKKRV